MGGWEFGPTFDYFISVHFGVAAYIWKKNIYYSDRSRPELSNLLYMARRGSEFVPPHTHTHTHTHTYIISFIGVGHLFWVRAKS